MIEITPNTEVRTIAVEAPSTIRIFDTLGIDFCCGGKKELQKACESAGLDVATVIHQLTAACSAEHPSLSQHWEHVPLSVLCSHIVRQHHLFTRNEIDRLGKLLNKLVTRHGQNYPELVAMQSVFAKLAEEMRLHMQKEEQDLFPYIEELEKCVETGKVPSSASFTNVENPIRVMMREHNDAGGLLRQIRTLSRNYQVPKDACPTFLGVYQGLLEFETDLHLHVHLENNILFPRAAALEAKILEAKVLKTAS